MGSHRFWGRIATLLLCALPPDAALRAADCNLNGTNDATDLLTGRSRDCNGNTIPDECDLKPSGFGFAEPQFFPLGLTPQVIVAADLNGDALADLVTGGSSAGVPESSLSVFPNDGQGHFGPALLLPLRGNSRGLAVSDLDGDGDEDLVSADYSSKDLTLFLNRGGATFLEAPHVPLEGRARQVTAG